MDTTSYYLLCKKLGIDPNDPFSPIGLPPIRGQWYYVDPTSGSNTNAGTLSKPVADIQTAYGLCTTGAGDGIVLLSAGTTAAGTTSYIDTPLTWSKHGITVFGIASGTRLYGRARIANVERTITGETISFPTATTIYDTAGGFLDAGFEVGNVIRVTTVETSNNGTGHIITAVTAYTITCAASTFVVQTAEEAIGVTLTSYCTNLVTVSGNNNAFINVHMGNFSSDELAVGSLKVTGHRNAFFNSHFIGAGHATPAATTGAYDLELNAAQENTFVGCTFGTDTIIRAAANGNIRFDTNVWRSRFYNCEILTYSATAGKGAILIADATAMDGVHVFKECQFILWNENGIGASTAAVIGTKPNSGQILFDGCSNIGWSAWGAAGMSGCVYVVNSDATASAAGGLAQTL